MSSSPKFSIYIFVFFCSIWNKSFCFSCFHILFGSFRFILKQICLFRLFLCSSKTPKQTETKFVLVLKMNRNKRKTDLVSAIFGSNWIFFIRLVDILLWRRLCHVKLLSLHCIILKGKHHEIFRGLSFFQNLTQRKCKFWGRNNYEIVCKFILISTVSETLIPSIFIWQFLWRERPRIMSEEEWRKEERLYKTIKKGCALSNLRKHFPCQVFHLKKYCCRLKGTVSQDFYVLVSCVKQFLLFPLEVLWDDFNFCWIIIAEIFKNR